MLQALNANVSENQAVRDRNSCEGRCGPTWKLATYFLLFASCDVLTTRWYEVQYPDLTPAEIQLAYEQRERRRRLKARSDVSRPTESTSVELQSDHVDMQDDNALSFVKLTATNGSDDTATLS